MKSIDKVILGTAQFGQDYGVNNKVGKPSLNDAIELLNYAYKCGIRTLDTAEAYGNAHKIIGKYHLLNPNSKFNIISKFSNNNETDLIEKIFLFIKELKIDKFKSILFHSFESYKTNLTKIEILRKNKQFNDKVISIGVSIYTNDEFEDLINDKLVDLVQIPFNLLDNFTYKSNLIKKAKDNGIEIHVRSVFLQGLFFKESSQNSISKSLETEINIIKKIALDLNIPLNVLAMNYCLQQDSIDNVLIGVDCKAQLQKNLSGISKIIPKKYINQINAIEIKNRDLLNPSLWN
tara:strand:- start:229 stop:1101 length:873 start_codon:yes stop_codon:yes gene_type:complete